MNKDFSNKTLREFMFKSLHLLTQLIAKLSPAMFFRQSPLQLSFLGKLTALKSQCFDDLENIKKQLTLNKGKLHFYIFFI